MVTQQYKVHCKGWYVNDDIKLFKYDFRIKFGLLSSIGYIKMILEADFI